VIRHIFSRLILSGTLSISSGLAFAASDPHCSDRMQDDQRASFWKNASPEIADKCVLATNLDDIVTAPSNAPLHNAILFSGDVEVLRALLERKGANPKARFRTGETALHMLPLRSQLDDELNTVIDLFVGAGANIDARDLKGMTPFLTAVQAGDVPSMKAFLTAGADLHAVNLADEGAIILALKNGHLEVVKALMEAGLDPNQAPGALIAALQTQNDVITRFVIENLEVVERRTNSTVTVAHIIAQYGTGEAMRALKDRGARLNIGFMTQHPIHFAAHHNQDPSVIEVIVSQVNEEVNEKTRNGFTPIMLAILKNPNPEVAQKLAELGADLSVKTMNGKTLFDLVKEREDDPKLSSLKNTQLFWDIHEARF
jgi:ankyrin repeat protein